MVLGTTRTSFTQLQSAASGDPRPTCTGSSRRIPPSLWSTTRAPTQPSRTRYRKPIAGICSKNILTTSPTTNPSRPGPWNQIRVQPCQSIAIIQRQRGTLIQIPPTPEWCYHRQIIEGTLWKTPCFLIIFLFRMYSKCSNPLLWFNFLEGENSSSTQHQTTMITLRWFDWIHFQEENPCIRYLIV